MNTILEKTHTGELYSYDFTGIEIVDAQTKEIMYR